ncbi:S8 family serine peptidase [Myxococcota bacterium]|nr:S8 family serine peptidase [Myxococcota bacterium]
MGLGGRAAHAFDDEPNDSCLAYEAIVPLTVGDGELSSSSDVDAYRLSGLENGDLRVLALNRSNPDDDLLVELRNASGSATLVSDTMSNGRAELSVAVTMPTSLCLRLSGSAGGYSIVTQFVSALPTVTDVHNLGGSHISFASAGTLVDLIGTGFGSSAAGTTVSFNGAHANVVSASGTSLRVRVPENASNGDIVVMRSSGASEPYHFLVGVSTPPTQSYTAPDDAYYDEVDGVGLFLNRTFVAFDYNYDSTDVAGVLDHVESLDGSRTGWSIVGEFPDVNAFQVEWTFSAAPTATDLEYVLDDLDTHAGVLFVEAEQVATADTFAAPADYDLFYDPETPGALGQINFEEARRLYWLSGLSSPPEPVDVVIPDDGLRFGADWDSSEAGTQDEFPDARFSLYEHEDTGWSSTGTDGHHVFKLGLTSPRPVHGNTTAGVMASANGGNPTWTEGNPRSTDDASGIWASFQVFGVDDDVDSSVDEGGEWPAGTVTVINLLGDANHANGTLNQPFMKRAIQAANTVMGTSTSAAPQVMSLSYSWTPPPWYYGTQQGWPSWSRVLEDVCRVRPLLLSAGNRNGEVAEFQHGAEVASAVCAGRALVVSGVHAGGADADTAVDISATDGANYGDDVGILAPYDGWFLPVASGTSTETWDPAYESVIGTSLATPAVASAYVLLRGILPRTGTGAMSDEAILALLVSTADDVSPLYTRAGAQVRLNLFEAIWTALRLAGVYPAMTRPPQIFVADYGDDEVVAQQVDPETGEVLGSATEIFTSTDGCYGPTDVEVHPLGDVLYALCVDTGTIAAWTTDTYEFVGDVELQGTVDTYSEMAIGQDGILRVGSIFGGDAVVESFDTWSGATFLDPETLSTAATGRVYGAAVSPENGADLAFGVTDNVYGGDDALVVVEPDDLGHGSSTISGETFASTSNKGSLRDVSWYEDGSLALGEFYGSGTTAGDEELGFGSGDVATINYCEQPISIAMDRAYGSDRGWVACTGTSNLYVKELDLGSISSSYSASTTLYLKTSSGDSSDVYPVFVEVPQNGAFLVIGGYSTSVESDTYVVDRSTATAGGSVYSGSYDSLSHAFYRPRGAAISPMLSFAAPRPGTKIAGIKRFHMIIRDPRIEAIDVRLDGTSVCVDDELADGSSEDCLLDVSTWSAGAHVISAVAMVDDVEQWAVRATYSTDW